MKTVSGEDAQCSSFIEMDEFEDAVSRISTESTATDSLLVERQMFEAPPSYEQSQPTHQNDPSVTGLEANYFRKLKSSDISFLNLLVGCYYRSATTAMTAGRYDPHEIEIRARPDGLFSEKRTRKVKRDKERYEDFTDLFVWRPDGVWRDGVRAFIDSKGIHVESKEQDWGLPEGERYKRAYRYELATENKKEVLKHYNNNVYSHTFYPKPKKEPNCCPCFIAVVVFLIFVGIVAYNIGKENTIREFMRRANMTLAANNKTIPDSNNTVLNITHIP